MDWNAGNTYVINLIPLGYLFIHWNAWIHWNTDWNAGKYICDEFYPMVLWIEMLGNTHVMNFDLGLWIEKFSWQR
jgi:hypothetical protein